MIRFFFCFQLSWLTPLICVSQNLKTVDSLETIIRGNAGANDYEPLHELVVEFAAIDNAKAFEYAVRAERAALRSGDTLQIRKSKRVKAQILLRLDRPIEALSAIQLYVRDPNWFRKDEEQLMLSNAMGVCHLMMGHFDQALEYFLHVNDVAKKLDNVEFEKISLKNIGVTYYKLKAYEKGLSHLLQARELERAIGEIDIFSAVNISLCYSHLGKYSIARQFLNESIQACGADCAARPLTHIKYAAGCLYYQMGEWSDASETFAQSIQLAQQINYHRMILDNIYFLAKISIETGDIRKAEAHLKEAEKIIHSGSPFNLEMIKIYEQLSGLYLQTRNLDRAFDYQSKYIKFRDSLYNEVVITHLMQLESEYLEKANETKIAEQENLLIAKQEIIRRQNALNVLSLLVILLSIGMLVSLFRTYRRKKLLNALLDQKVNERTAALELSRQQLYQELRIQELSSKKLIIKVSERLSTMRGLCQIARGEVQDAVGQGYLDRIEKTFEEIQSLMKCSSSR